MKIHIVRHGQTELNVQGLINGDLEDALTDTGKEQARKASLLLPDNIKHIYSSSLNRAKQTAEIINEKYGVPMTIHNELKEVNFGILNGSPYLDEYKARHQALDYDWRPSGECIEDVKERVLKILEIIRNENTDEEVLVVAHGGIVRLINFLESGEIIKEIENASIHTFDLDKIFSNNK